MPVTQTKRLLRCDMIAALAKLEPEALVRFSEKTYQNRIAEISNAILASERHIVMLTGPSATGKTTSAHKLAKEISSRGVKAAVLSLDDFFVGVGKYPKRADGTDDYECVEALDLPHIQTCLRALYDTGACDAPVFDFITQMPSLQTQHIDCRGGVAIVEGLHAFNPLLTAQLPGDAALHVYASLREEYKAADGRRLLATRDIRLARRIVRDWQFRGHDADFTFEIWENVCQAEQRYIKAFKNRADLLLDTSFSDEACLWGKLLQELHAAKHTERLQALRCRYAEFPPLSTDYVPRDSMLREFIGNK